MNSRKLALKLAGTALALVAVAMGLLGLWGHFPPLDLEIWSPLITAACGFASAVMFITADAMDEPQPGGGAKDAP